jgi:signal transduction histidine kinase
MLIQFVCFVRLLHLLAVRCVKVLGCVLALSAGLAWSQPTVPSVAGLDSQGVLWVDPATDRQALSTAAQWCMDESEQLDVQAVHRGACPLHLAKGSDLTQGLRAGALWVRLQLGNGSAEPLQRWMVVGHPRLQEVTLWTEFIGGDGSSHWQAAQSGIGTALNSRAIRTSYPVLPVLLAPHSARVVYLRVASETSLDASMALWRPQAYQQQQERVDMLHMLAMGCLLMSTLFSLGLYAVIRDRIYLFFALGMLGELILEGGYSGLMALHFWPGDQAFPVHMLTLGSGLGTVFLGVFVLQFLGQSARHNWATHVFKIVLSVFILGVALAFFKDYRFGTQIRQFSLLGLLAVGIGLIVLRIKQGERHANYLLVAFVPVIGVELLRAAVAYGIIYSQSSYILAAPWALIAVSPLLLLGLIQRSRDLYAELLKSRTESQSRVEFLAQMSHELRAPLNTVQGYAQLMVRGNSTMPAADAGLAIGRAGARLLGMIDEILDYARGQANRLLLDVVPVHWPTFLHDLEQHGADLAMRHGNEFAMVDASHLQTDGVELPSITGLMVDERRLRQVLDNLLSNAFRYTKMGKVTLTCRAIPLSMQMAQLVFEVADSGPGIALAEQDQIFEPFVRGKTAQASGIRGAGLGLAVARQLASVMGGTLTLDSTVGTGSRFTLTVKCPSTFLAQAPKNTSLLAEIGGYEGPTRRVLVVDDDASAKNIVCLFLQSFGFDVVHADSAIAAMALLTPSVNLVITDQFMDDGDGWMLLKALRQQFPAVPVLLLSASDPQRPEEYPKEMVFDVALLKPLNAQSLLWQIGQLLNLHWITNPNDTTAVAGSVQYTVRSSNTHPNLQQLQNLLLDGDFTGILEWTEALAKNSPTHSQFAADVAQAALKLDFFVLQKMARGASNDSG